MVTRSNRSRLQATTTSGKFMSAQWSELPRLIVKDMVGHDDRLIGHVDLVERVLLFLASSTTA
jgi:hypothetical protein